MRHVLESIDDDMSRKTFVMTWLLLGFSAFLFFWGGFAIHHLLLHASTTQTHDRSSRSLIKTGFHQKWNLRGLKLRSMLDIVLEGVLEASCSDLGRVLGGQDASQDAPRRHQDGPRRRQDAPKTAKDASKTPLRRVQMPLRPLQMRKH